MDQNNDSVPENLCNQLCHPMLLRRSFTNRKKSSARISIEHVIGFLKRFRVLSKKLRRMKMRLLKGYWKFVRDYGI